MTGESVSYSVTAQVVQRQKVGESTELSSSGESSAGACESYILVTQDELDRGSVGERIDRTDLSKKPGIDPRDPEWRSKILRRSHVGVEW